MPELIDRIELRKDFCNMCEAMQPEMIDCDKKCCMSMQIIDEQPTIEPKVRCGRWIARHAEFGMGKMYECSVCHGICEHYTHIHYNPSPYCMHCGARMDATDTNVGGKGGADNG